MGGRKPKLRVTEIRKYDTAAGGAYRAPLPSTKQACKEREIYETKMQKLIYVKDSLVCECQNRRRLVFRTLVESDRLILNVESHDDIVMEYLTKNGYT